MDPYLSELFARPDDFQLINKVFVRIAERCDGGDLSGLSELPKQQKVVLDVWGAGGIIGNGGFQFLFESGLADMPSIAESYEAIGVSRAAAAFREAMSVFPQSTPHADVDERLAYLEKLGPTIEAKLERLSKEVWECDREVKAKLARYVRANATSFADLPPSPWENIEEIRNRDLPASAADADEESVIRWLESIDVSVQRWNDGSHEVSQTAPPPEGNPIISLRLSQHRNSTDTEMSQIVRCRVLHGVREITLDESSISRRGLLFLSKFPDLRLLSLANTDVTDSDLIELFSLSRLESLNLARTSVTNAGLKQLQGIQSLRSLDLSKTPIDDAGLKSLALLTNLSSLELRSTPIDGSGLTPLAKLPLDHLMLTEAAVTDDGLRSLAQFRQLKSLGIEDTEIGDLTLSHLANCSQLENLNLSRTKVTDDGLAYVARLLKLILLDLCVTPIEGRGLKHLEGLKQLEVLRLFGTHCGDEGVHHLSRIKSLKRLSMGKTRITNACLLSLSQLPNLNELSIHDPGIRGGPELRRLENLRSLTWISLPKQLEKSRDVIYLQRQLPNARFSFY
jgi:Leucine-rich repeat (LRR) protein